MIRKDPHLFRQDGETEMQFANRMEENFRSRRELRAAGDGLTKFT